MSRVIVLALLMLIAAPAHAQIAAGSFHKFAFRQHPGAQLPLDAVLNDEEGRRVLLGDALGRRPAVLVLEYLHCSNLCGLVLRGAVHAIGEAHLKPGRDIDLVAISIDPRDTPAVAADARTMYSQPLGGTAGVHFLTGSSDQVKRVASAVGFPYQYDKSIDQFAHPAGFVVVTPSGRISRYILGVNPTGGALREAVTRASTGEITPAAHPLLLLCFGYDPEPGSVASLVMRLVRLVSVAAALGCALLIFFLARRRTA